VDQGAIDGAVDHGAIDGAMNHSVIEGAMVPASDCYLSEVANNTNCKLNYKALI
jgi:hypothetical protein